MLGTPPARGGARRTGPDPPEGAAARLAAKYAEQAKYRMRPGQLVILDEASMIGTAAAAELARQAETAGTKLLFVGDAAQIDAVEAGGFLGWLERNTDAPVLSQVWRFKAEWERAASLRLRTGDTDILATYAEHGRIHTCPEGTAADRAYQAWIQDTKEDITASLLIAGDNQTVSDLNTRAQLDLALEGRVNLETTTTLRYGLAGIGDLILARQNDRRLKDDQGHFIKNGTRLKITGIRHDGSITAARTDTGATITLDPDYLKASVELGYACTAHRSQGVTVDSAHTVVMPGLARELFYVAMTRGRNGNTCYVDLPDPDEDDTPDEWGMVRKIVPEDAMSVLKGVLANQAHEMTAHEIRDAEHGHANDFARLIFEYDYTATAEKTLTVLEWLDTHISPKERNRSPLTGSSPPCCTPARPPRSHRTWIRTQQQSKTSSKRQKSQPPGPNTATSAPSRHRSPPSSPEGQQTQRPARSQDQRPPEPAHATTGRRRDPQLGHRTQERASRRRKLSRPSTGSDGMAGSIRPTRRHNGVGRATQKDRQNDDRLLRPGQKIPATPTCHRPTPRNPRTPGPTSTNNSPKPTVTSKKPNNSTRTMKTSGPAWEAHPNSGTKTNPHRPRPCNRHRRTPPGTSRHHHPVLLKQLRSHP